VILVDARHHRAQRGGPPNTVVVFVPIEGGGIKETKRAKPPGYPSNRREPWRPASRPPSKGAAALNLLRNIARQERDVREFLEQSRHAHRAS
jgi:hypothetical protein